MNNQPTLDKWFKITKTNKNPPIKIPKYFYLNWYDKKLTDYRNAIFCDNIPSVNDGCRRFTTSINWKVPIEHRNRKTKELGIKYIKNKLIICGDFVNRPEYPFEESDYGEAIPLLKSNLQKCVRRMITDKAIRTSYELMKLDYQHFLRRLPIIILEDTCLCTGFSTVVWMMAANGNGWIPTKIHVEWLLGLVHQITMNPRHDMCDYNRQTNPYSMWKGLHKIDSNTSTCILAMYLRMMYGGMRNDRKMLASLMDERLTLGQSILSLDTVYVNLDSLCPFSKDDIIPEAVDYHCYPWIIYKLCESSEVRRNDEGPRRNDEGPRRNDDEELIQVEKEQNELEEKIRKTIWHCRSGVNKRDNVTVDSEYQEIYGKIKRTLWDLSNYIIYKST